MVSAGCKRPAEGSAAVERLADWVKRNCRSYHRWPGRWQQQQAGCVRACSWGWSGTLPTPCERLVDDDGSSGGWAQVAGSRIAGPKQPSRLTRNLMRRASS